MRLGDTEAESRGKREGATGHRERSQAERQESPAIAFFVLYCITRHERRIGPLNAMTGIPGAVVHQGAIIAEVRGWEAVRDAVRVYGNQDEQSHESDPLGILRDCNWGTIYGWRPGEYRHRLTIMQIMPMA